MHADRLMRAAQEPSDLGGLETFEAAQYEYIGLSLRQSGKRRGQFL
jgi:hypothetical protein